MNWKSAVMKNEGTFVTYIQGYMDEGVKAMVKFKDLRQVINKDFEFHWCMYRPNTPAIARHAYNYNLSRLASHGQDAGTVVEIVRSPCSVIAVESLSSLSIIAIAAIVDMVVFAVEKIRGVGFEWYVHALYPSRVS
jgi:hypothetical protein